MGRLSWSAWGTGLTCCVAALAWATLASSRSAAQPPSHGHNDERSRPVYQRRAFESHPMHGRSHHAKHHRVIPPESANWFQRPYPYHLDYYKHKWGGSYEPYFGNLYGPPQVVTAPPYFGPYFGHYGGFGQPGGFNDHGGQPGWLGGSPPAGANGENLPAPVAEP